MLNAAAAAPLAGRGAWASRSLAGRSSPLISRQRVTTSAHHAWPMPASASAHHAARGARSAWACSARATPLLPLRSGVRMASALAESQLTAAEDAAAGGPAPRAHGSPPRSAPGRSPRSRACDTPRRVAFPLRTAAPRPLLPPPSRGAPSRRAAHHAGAGRRRHEVRRLFGRREAHATAAAGRDRRCSQPVDRDGRAAGPRRLGRRRARARRG